MKIKEEMSWLSILFRLTRKGLLIFICWRRASASFSKNTFYDKTSGSALFLIFHKISGSYSYKIVLIYITACNHGVMLLCVLLPKCQVF